MYKGLFLSGLLLLAACGGGGGDTTEEIQTFTLSGEITTLSGMTFDHDVNDPAATYAGNDDFATAQFLPSPFSLGGYVNIAGAGEEGRSFAAGDQKDFYRLRLIRDQIITLNTVNPNFAQLALSLYTVAKPPILVSALNDNNASKSVVAPASGEFFLEVEALTGASAYTLTTGLSQVSARGSRSMDFVPGEVLVKFQPDGGDLAGRRLIESLDLRLLAERAGGVFLYALSSQAASGKRADLKQRTLEAVHMLQATPGVRYAEPNYLLRPYRIPSDTLYHLQWHYPIVNLPAAWDLETGSESVLVAVIDTGVLPDHPDLQLNLAPGFDFITDLERAADGDGPDADPTDPGIADNPENSAAFHGTHVIGVIAASSDNELGVAGTAWGVKAMPLRALGSLDGTVADVAEAIHYAAGLANSTGELPVAVADIINMSFGTTDFSQVMADAVTAARQAGVIMLAAAGNDSSSVHHFPAALPEVISVNAIDSTGLRASYSNIGSSIDITAPGGDTEDHNGDGLQDAILSTVGDATGNRSYELLNGTSMSCAHASGIVALMESFYRRHSLDMTPTVFENFLISGKLTQDSGDTGWDEIFGYGLIDAYKAVAAAIEDVTNSSPPALPPKLSVSPASLNFGTSGSEAEIVLTNQGADVPGFMITSTGSNKEWLQVVKLDEPDNELAAAGLGSYLIKVDRQHPQLQNDDLYQAVVTFTANQSDQSADVSFTVYLQVSSIIGAPNAGTQHVNLVDTRTGEIFQTLIVDPQGGTYPYQFENIPAGRYLVTSHTDADNDNQPCENGESCGAYPTLGGANAVEVDSDLTGLNFATSLSVNIF